MITIVNSNNIHQFGPEMEQVYKLRNQVFVQEKGWANLARPDNREIDQFDNADAVHMLCLIDGNLVGYQRMLPTTKPYLLSSVYPQLCEDELPNDSTTWEWTRYAVLKEHRARGRILSPVANHLLSAIVEWGLQNNITSVVIEMQPLWLLRLVQLHFRVFPLGIAQVIDGEEVLAVQAFFDARTLSRLQEVRGNSVPSITQISSMVG